MQEIEGANIWIISDREMPVSHLKSMAILLFLHAFREKANERR